MDYNNCSVCKKKNDTLIYMCMSCIRQKYSSDKEKCCICGTTENVSPCANELTKYYCDKCWEEEFIRQMKRE